MSCKLIGKKADITDKESIYYNEWGIIKHFDGEYYHIAMWNGENTMIFKRKVYGDITTSIVCKIANLFIDNDIDFVGYFSDGYHPAEFTVRRSGKKWDDIIDLINSIKPCKYEYKKETFYLTNDKRNGVIGNMQIVCKC